MCSVSSPKMELMVEVSIFLYFGEDERSNRLAETVALLYLIKASNFFVAFTVLWTYLVLK